jgi:hypothetical protein
MVKVGASTLALLCLCVLPLYAGSPRPFRDVREFATAAAQQLAPKIIAKQGRLKARVAVFPFSDQSGKVSAKLGHLHKILQGELITQLQKAGQGQFSVLTQQGLDTQLGSVDPAGVGLTPDATFEVMNNAQIQVAITGRVALESVRELEKNKKMAVDIQWQIYCLPGRTVEEQTAALSSFDVCVTCGSGPLNPGGSGVQPHPRQNRFQVEILDDMGNSLPLKYYDDVTSEFHNTFFLILDPKYEGKNYQIRLTNRGTPAVGYDSAPDKDARRLYSVAVLVDGVNSFFEEVQKGKEPEPVVRHPAQVSHWVLTGPGWKLTSANGTFDGIKNGRLAATQGAGGSVLTIPGFQVNQNTAKQFTFVRAAESIAATHRLFTNDIGLIAVHFYPQAFPQQDKTQEWYAQTLELAVPKTLPRNPEAAGTKEGAPLHHGTFTLHFDSQDTPVEVWRIFYRYEGQPLPADLTPTKLRALPSN